MNKIKRAKRVIKDFTHLEQENALLRKQKEEWKKIAIETVEAKNKREAELQTEINKLQCDNDVLRQAYAQLTADVVVKELNRLTTKKPKKK
jgi:uncharacterized protein YdaT